MVIIFSSRKSKCEVEIIEILKKYGYCHFSDKSIYVDNKENICISTYKKIQLNLNKGIVIFTEKTQQFLQQNLPIGVIGVCDDNNKSALEIFKKCNNAVITCGTNNKNTVTISSMSDKRVLITLQRTVIDNEGKRHDPCEYKINLTKEYTPFSIMAATITLVLNGITPIEF